MVYTCAFTDNAHGRGGWSGKTNRSRRETVAQGAETRAREHDGQRAPVAGKGPA
jgi:hypothetical protein